MSKLLKDVTDYLKETQGLSMSQISKDLGKGRNYIREAIERDISMDKQMEILFNLYCRGLGYKDLLDIIQQQATKYHVAQEQADEFERQLISVNEENRKLEKECGSLKRKLDNSDRLYCESQSQRKDLEQRLCNATAKNKELEQQAVILNKEIDGLNELLAKEKKVASYLVGVERRAEELEKELFDEKEACDVGSKQIDRQNKTIASMEKSFSEMTKAGQGIAGQLSAMTGSRNMWCLLFTLAVLFSCVLLYHAF